MALYHVISTFSEQQPVYETFLKWSCSDECKYTCMWITVDAFQRDGMDIPQFYGKVSIMETGPILQFTDLDIYTEIDYKTGISKFWSSGQTLSVTWPNSLLYSIT